jgi:hypothetical protein
MPGYWNDLAWGVPGLSAAIETYTAALTWGREELLVRSSIQLSGATRDAGNTGHTTHLRPGLLLGQITAQPGLWKQYDPAATDGSQIASAILLHDANATDFLGTNTARWMPALFGGCVKSASIIGLDAVARGQMRGRFWFDDDNTMHFSQYQSPLVEVAKAADYTVVAADAGTLFTTLGATGAIVFTLPTIAAGVGPFEFLNLVDQNMSVVSAGSNDNIVGMHDLTADSIAFSTASQKIGARLRIRANQAGTKWYAEFLSPNTPTFA